LTTYTFKGKKSFVSLFSVALFCVGFALFVRLKHGFADQL